MMQVSKKVPFDDPDTLNMVRALYVVSNVIIFGLYFYVQMQINKKKGMSHLPPSSDLSIMHGLAAMLTPPTDLKTLKYVEPAPMGSSEEPKLVTTTVHAYDLQQLRALYKTQLMGVGMMAVMHLYMKYTNPLLIQSIIPLKGAFEGNLVKIHVFGQPAEGDLKRPFKAAAGFMAALQQGGAVASDKKTVEAAEKAGRGGAKEE